MKLEYGPREKLEKNGIHALEDKELLAILIKTGSKNEKVLELSERILREISSLKSLTDYSYEELMTFTGIGKAKAMTIVSALELGTRIRKQYIECRSLKTINDEINYLKDDFINENTEKIIIIYLNASLKIISKQTINSTSINSVYFDIKDILKRAIKLNAVYIIISHNHPSGDINPSLEDIKTVKRLENKLNEFQISLYDSLIFTDEYYYSMKYSLEPHKLK
ncbi:DNA repair protein RadC [bacterium]|nr:DNA repair protein RadC [bacterium]